MESEKMLPPGDDDTVVIEEHIVQEKIPVMEVAVPHGAPSPTAQSWGVVISIIVIVLMIITGAFYAWGQRIAQNIVPDSEATSTQ